jgi:hypothetical protein
MKPVDEAGQATGVCKSVLTLGIVRNAHFLGKKKLRGDLSYYTECWA